MNQNNYNTHMNPQQPSPNNNTSDEQTFLQQLFANDINAMQLQQPPPQQQVVQQQPFYFNPNVNLFAPAAAAPGMINTGLPLMGIDPQMMLQQQQQQPQQIQPTQPIQMPLAQPQQMQEPTMQPLQVQQPNLYFNNNEGTAVFHPITAQQPPSNTHQPPPPTTQPSISNIGGVSVPPMAAGTPSLLHVEAAATAAATAAAPSRKRKSKESKSTNTKTARAKTSTTTTTSDEDYSSSTQALLSSALQSAESIHPPKPKSQSSNMTPQQKAQSSRDRNREHARCTRLRKKAYVSKLKELVDGLHAERSSDTKKRREAVRALAEVQEKRRKMILNFLKMHARYEEQMEVWRDVLEEGFWMKMPVTPFRSFRRWEIDKVCFCLLKCVL